MPALLRYFSDLIHFKTSKLNPIPLHGNPVLDNFVFKHAAVQTGRTFASAHSCGLRPRTMMIFCNLQIFASAHSCGLRLHRQKIPPVMLALCLSAFVRVATLGLNVNCRVTSFATAHSRGLRRCWKPSLTATRFFATAHSRGLRLRKSNAAHCEFAARR